MKSKLKTMIYPFDVESAPLVRNNELIGKYNITQAVSPNGWGFNEKDVGYVDGGQDVGITIDSNFDKALENSDSVFFNQSSQKLDFNNVIYPKIIKAAKNSKSIICTIEIEEKLIDEISYICHKNNKSFEYFSNKFDEIITPPNEEILPISVPVIFVSGVAERTNKFEIQLNLRKYMKEMGYKISQIGTRHYCELMGFHSFPKFMYNKSISESEKVTLFNYYIKTISIMENPDVIIIGIPGGSIPFNNKFTNKFGILSYEISQAVKPDVSILTIPYGNIPQEYFETMSESYKYKFGYSIDCCNIANSSLNIAASQIASSLQYITMDYNFINEKKKIYLDSNMPIYNILDIHDAKNMCEFLIGKLQEYGKNNVV